MKASDNKFPGIILNEAANDGSDFTNPDADYRRLFLGEDGELHLKDSAGAVTDVGGGIADQGSFTYLDATEAAAPGTPASGKVRLYAKSDGLLYSKDDAGSETVVSGGGGSGSDLVQTWSGGGSVYISGLRGSPDIRVAGANDDEFETTDTSDPMTGWTTLGSPTVHDMNSTVKSHYYVKKSATGTAGQHGIYKAMSPTFTVTAKLADVTLNGNDNCAGVFVGEATPGKMLLAGLYYNSGVNSRRQVLSQIWTNPTTFSSTVATIEGTLEAPIYFRAVVTSSTDISTYYSANGLVWRLIASATNPSFTVGSAGVFVMQNNASFDLEALFDWIRFT